MSGVIEEGCARGCWLYCAQPENLTTADTVRSLVERVKIAATETGIDVSPSDVGFIISCFLEGLMGTGSSLADAWLQRLADEAAQVRDE